MNSIVAAFAAILPNGGSGVFGPRKVSYRRANAPAVAMQYPAI